MAVMELDEKEGDFWVLIQKRAMLPGWVLALAGPSQ